MSEHRIKLPAPWQVQPAQGATPIDPSQRCARWRIERRFNRPTGLTNENRLALEIEIAPDRELAAVESELNGQRLSIDNSGKSLYRLAIPLDLLQASNRLVLELEFQEACTLTLPRVAILIS